jgi:hypothetical protein
MLKISLRASALLLFVLAGPADVFAQCAGKCRSDEYLSGQDSEYCYCTSRDDRRSLQASVAAIGDAAATRGCSGGDYCNYFIARIADVRNIPYFRDVLYPGNPRNDVGGPDEARKANELYGFIAKAVRSPASGWRQLSEDDAQEYANRGKFVIGVAKNHDPARSGHIAIVAPAQMPKSGRGSGPWVRDAQNPSSSVKASRRFGSSVVAPIWALWEHGSD